MGYALCISACVRCKTVFGYNPNRVPSMRVTRDGEKEPVCAACFDALNRKRVELGMPPWPQPSPGAYEPVDEDEL